MNSKDKREDREQEKRQTEIQEEYKNSGFDGYTRSVGDVTWSRTETRHDQIGTSGEISERRNLSGSSFGEQILGGTISQLISKAEDQLAVLENSAKETKKYIFELKEVLEVIEKNQHD